MGYQVRNICKGCGRDVGEWAILNDCCHYCGQYKTGEYGVYFLKEAGRYVFDRWRWTWYLIPHRTYKWEPS